MRRRPSAAPGVAAKAIDVVGTAVVPPTRSVPVSDAVTPGTGSARITTDCAESVDATKRKPSLVSLESAATVSTSWKLTGKAPFAVRWAWSARPICLRLFVARVRAAASRTF
jgi:hypothetical protein